MTKEVTETRYTIKNKSYITRPIKHMKQYFSRTGKETRKIRNLWEVESREVAPNYLSLLLRGCFQLWPKETSRAWRSTWVEEILAEGQGVWSSQGRVSERRTLHRERSQRSVVGSPQVFTWNLMSICMSSRQEMNYWKGSEERHPTTHTGPVPTSQSGKCSSSWDTR